MPAWHQRLIGGVVEVFFRDPARPVEWISLLMLAGFAQFMMAHPEELSKPLYFAFRGLPANAWAGIIITVIVAQIVAMRPSAVSASVRFLAMAGAAGLWTVVALAFWSTADTTPLTARWVTVLPLATIATGIYLGTASWRR